MIPRRLFELVSERKVVPFVGSGFSIPSGAPSWSSLTDAMRENLVEESTSKLVCTLQQQLNAPQFSELIDSLAVSDHAIKEYLIEQIGHPNLLPNLYHEKLNNVQFDTIVTTNWDTLIESSLDALKTPFNVIFRDNDVSRYDPMNRIQIIKIHGTIRDPDSLVFRKSQYEKYWAERNILFNLLATLAATKSYLFLGYGFGDPNMLEVLERLKHHLGPTRREHYALVYGNQSDSREWERLGIIPVPAKIFDPENSNYDEATVDFLTELTLETQSVALSNIDRAQLVNSELRRLIRHMPPSPFLRMRGSLGWLSNPKPEAGEPLYGTQEQDNEEYAMTELLSAILVANRRTKVKCILHLNTKPLERTFSKRGIARRLARIEEMLSLHPGQIDIVHDALPSYTNHMLFDEKSTLIGFKHSHILGINKVAIYRDRRNVTYEIKHFDEDFEDIRAQNEQAARNLGLSQNDYIRSMIRLEVERNRAEHDMERSGPTVARFSDEARSFCDALAFAIVHHERRSQLREDESTPYFVHLLRVIERLRCVGDIDDYHVLSAAALHDVVEDCEVELSEVNERFGEHVGLLVKEITKSPIASETEYREQIAAASDATKIIKLADKWDNVCDLRIFGKSEFGARPIGQYLDEATWMLEACAMSNMRLARCLREEIDRAKLEAMGQS